MKIHEYQGKEIFRKYGVATPRGFPAFSIDEAVEAAKKLGGKVWVVKAQIHAGGRGKGGGVKVAKSLDEARNLSKKILGMNLVTHQTGPEGQKVRRLLIEEGADIRKELYVGMVVDRGTQKVVLMASSEGGMDIEEVAATTPEKIKKVFIDPVEGLTDADADEIAIGIGIPQASVPQARAIFKALYRCFDEADASLPLSRRSLLAYAVSAPVMTVAAGFGVNLATPSTANALPLPLTPPDTVDHYDIGDSLVQTAMGFNIAEGEAFASGKPRPLPMQILDEATGYLMAFGAAAALWRQQREGGSWHVQVSLAQTGQWQRARERQPDGPKAPRPALKPDLDASSSGFGELLAIRHSAQLARTPARWTRPSMPPGSHRPAWPAS